MILTKRFLSVFAFVLLGISSFASAAQIWKGSTAFVKIHDDGSGQVLVGGDVIFINKGGWVIDDYEFLAVGKIHHGDHEVEIHGYVFNSGNLSFNYNGQAHYVVKKDASITHNRRSSAYCRPENPSTAGFNYIELLIEDRGDYTLAIEWNRPVGREDVEEFPVEYFDDMTMYGFIAEKGDPILSFYNEDDFDGARVELTLDKSIVSLVCVQTSGAR